jgi:alkanesulfonate monooxygenase SsuD/methylene tetrahydromethanopterin reductase-like flavin-dependent oxidoreductase (luciferase family)
VRFGIHNSSWLDSPDSAEAFEAVKAKAQWAEDHGFVWFSVLDHMIQIPRVGAPDEPCLEGWTVLSGLAAVTSRIRLATLATAVGYRNPAHLAKIAASVDLISRGRLTLGIGAGFFEDEYKQYGWEFPLHPATRIGQMEEAVQLILKMWPWLLARDAATVAAKRERLAARGPLRGFVGTVSEAIDLIGQYQDAGVDQLINADRRNDVETRELFVSDVMPHFA